LATKNSKSVAEARLFIGILALSRVRLGLVLDSISNLILTWGLLRFETRFGFGVHWGKVLYSDSIFVGGWRARVSELFSWRHGVGPRPYAVKQF
jgi:hypothetical protein